jgi:hypothetical protein
VKKKRIFLQTMMSFSEEILGEECGVNSEDVVEDFVYIR